MPRGRCRDDDVGVVLGCAGHACCEVSAAGGGEEDGGREALMSPHRLRSPLCSHTPAGNKEKISAL